MRLWILLAAASLCLCPAVAQPGNRLTGNSQAQNPRSDNKNPAAKPAPFPLQLEMRVPFEPTAFPSGPRFYLMYELHLTNFGTNPLFLTGIEVLDADGAADQPIATFEAEQLEAMLQPLGGKALSAPNERLVIASGQSAIVFMSVTFDRSAHIPDRLFHHVITVDSAAEGALIATHYTELHVLGPPVEGADWLAADGPSNDQDNHHRRGVIILDGQAVDSRRYAIDWKQIRGGVSFSGDARDVRSYYSYGKSVLAVADGRVVSARDGLPDNVPGHDESFHPAVPMTLETVAGNTIILDLGGGQFAYYMHLQPGSLRVKAGDRVRRGQLVARVGDSGDAREPHLHFEVTTSSKPLAGEGVPYLIDRYRCKSASDGHMELRIHELPLDNSVVVFREEHGK
jgi:murein DD-endopeptidase MepM/ murein hydrolase activator NlpD